MNFKKIVWIAIFIALVCALPQVSRAGSLGSDILSMFPKDSGELAYADLKQARQFPWFTQLKEQMLPPKFREFETFLASAGIDPRQRVNPCHGDGRPAFARRRSPPMPAGRRLVRPLNIGGQSQRRGLFLLS